MNISSFIYRLNRYAVFAALASFALGACSLRLPPPEETYCDLPSPAGMVVRLPEPGPEGVPDDGYPAIVFHHGIGANWTSTAHDMAAAVANGFAAVGLNTTFSNKVLFQAPAIAKTGAYYVGARQVRCAIRKLRAESTIQHPELADSGQGRPIDGNRIALSGFSMGGILAYHAALPNEEGRARAAEILGPDPLASFYAEESGQADALIALGTGADVVLAGTNCAVVPEAFHQRDDSGETIYGSDGRPRLADWVKDRGSLFECGSRLAPTEAVARVDAIADARQGFETWFEEAIATARENGWLTDDSVQGTPLVVTGETAAQSDVEPLFVAADDPAASRYVSTAARNSWGRYSVLSNVRPDGEPVPVLIAHGELDSRAPIAHGALVYDLLAREGFAAKFVRFPNATHTWADNEWKTSPGRLARDAEIIAFLARDLGWLEPGTTDRWCIPATPLAPNEVADAAERIVPDTLTDAQADMFAEEIARLRTMVPSTDATPCESPFDDVPEE